MRDVGVNFGFCPDHAADGRIRPSGEAPVESRSPEPASSEGFASAVSRRALDRRHALKAFAAAGATALAAPPAAAKATLSKPRADDMGFMRLAIEEAAKGDFPFGAVIVRDGAVKAVGRNMGVKTNDPTAHGEMVAIRRFVADHPAGELEGTTLYTSGEPCPMCMSAILWCKISRVVYAASIEQLAKRIGQIMLPSRTVADAAPFADIDITGGVLAGEALALFDRK